MTELEYSAEDGSATILLNRPHGKNAFTLSMVDECVRALAVAQDDPDVRVVIVTGAGGSFCSGVDLAEFDGHKRTPIQKKQFLTDRVHPIAVQMQHLDEPVIAAIVGPATGAGMDMALLCDLRIVGQTARFIREAGGITNAMVLELTEVAR